jgi:hypothetical protein
LGTLLQNTGRKEEANHYLESAANFFEGLKNVNFSVGLVNKSI